MELLKILILVLPLGEGPGIEGFQIIGDAKPGGRLLGCGYPVRETSLCMFQVNITQGYVYDVNSSVELLVLVFNLFFSTFGYAPVGSSLSRWH